MPIAVSTAAACALIVSALGRPAATAPSPTPSSASPTATASPSPSASRSASARPTATAPPNTTPPAACALLGDASIAQAFGPTATHTALIASADAASSTCITTVIGGGAYAPLIVTVATSGEDAYLVSCRAAGTQPLPKLGDAACWDPVESTVDMLRRGVLYSVGVSSGDFPATYETSLIAVERAIALTN